MLDAPEMEPDGPEPANLRFLRLLVTGLTGVMIAGLVVLLTLVVIQVRTPGPELPDRVSLPTGTKAQAYTQGRGWIAIVTEDNRILILSEDGKTVLQEVVIDLPGE